MTAREPLPLVVALLASLVVGNGLAALANAPPNDACSDFGDLREGATSSSALELWPLGRRCDYEVGGQAAYSTLFVPSAAELYAWIVGAALLLAFAALRGDEAAARGAAAAATLSAMAGVAWQYAGIQLAFIAMTLFGAPLVVALDYAPATAGRTGAQRVASRGGRGRDGHVLRDRARGVRAPRRHRVRRPRVRAREHVPRPPSPARHPAPP